jgi:hypothetical protein
MYEESRWLPPNFPTTGFLGMPLPRMPHKKVLRAAYQYGPKIQLTLSPSARNLQQTHDEREQLELIVEIKRPLDIGYGNRTQTVLGIVLKGSPEMIGARVIVRLFDSLYVDPGHLSFIPYGNPQHTLLSQ